VSFEFNPNPFGAREDFRRARRRAALQEIVFQLKGKSSDLLSYQDVVDKLKGSEVSARELKDIPINSIVGSVGRYQDFNRQFLPRDSIHSERWAKVKMAMTGLKGVPPIEVYQIGEVYFVKDGNHRVSVAREMGFNHFQAYVTQVQTKVPLTLNDQPDELIIKAELAKFLEQTRLDQIRSDADLTVTVPGQYAALLEHINVHRYYMGIDEQREVSYADAVTHWYETLYLPVIDIIRRRGMLREFSARTDTDLYLYITQHRAELEQTLGWDISAETAAGDIEPRASGYRPTSEPLREAATLNKGSKSQSAFSKGPLFADILVAIDGDDSGWNSLSHAALIAQREKGAQLHGLHIVSAKSKRQGPHIEALQSTFSERCRQLDLSGRLAIDSGKRINRICQRARYTDLTVVCLSCGPAAKKLGEGLRTLLRSCPRPMLVVSAVKSPLDSMLLAYDGSELSREALYTAAYLASQWDIKLAVLTAHDDQVSADKIQQQARHYLESHGIEASYVIKTKIAIVEAILDTAKEQSSNLILMGAYGRNAPRYINVGIAVAPVLQQSNIPVLICG
jgi:nucleotide-binding universal stress UspA family protein